jgi:hypothetical protein
LVDDLVDLQAMNYPTFGRSSYAATLPTLPAAALPACSP